MLSVACVRRLGLVFFVMVLGSPAAIAETFNSKDEKAHGDWYSLYLYLGEDRQGRAVNTKSNGETLVLDVPIGSCNSYVSQLQISFDQSAEKTTTQDALGVRARIDRNPVHDLDAKIHLRRGEKVMYIPFSANDPVRFWQEVRNGRTIRFEVKMRGEENAYTSFSLDGSAAATARAKSICEQRSPSSYFDDDDREGEPTDRADKPDSAYF